MTRLRVRGASRATSTHPAVVTTATLPNGKVLVAGGSDHGRMVPTAPSCTTRVTGTWSVTGSLNICSLLVTQRRLLQNGKVLVAGGSGHWIFGTKCGAIRSDHRKLDCYREISTLTRSGHTATLLQNGKVLIAGGTDDDDL